jgi:phage terminase small subunit
MVMVRLLAITLVRLESCAAYTSQHGQFFKSGRPRPSVEVEDKLISRASTLADKLGMTPTSRAKLGLDLAHTQASLAQLMSDAADDTPTRTPPRPDDIEGSATDA